MILGTPHLLCAHATLISCAGRPRRTHGSASYPAKQSAAQREVSICGAVAQRFRALLQLLEIVRVGDLGDLARPLGLVDLDAQLPHLLSELFLASVHLSGHTL